MLELLEKLKRTLQELSGTIKSMEKRETLYWASRDAMYTDVSPNDTAPDELGCVDSVSSLIRKIFPDLNFPSLYHTARLFAYLEKSPSFKPVDKPLPGDIVLNVTGTGNGRVKHGHTGVCGYKWIMSNDSRTGLWLANYTYPAWKAAFESKGGMVTYYYRIV